MRTFTLGFLLSVQLACIGQEMRPNIVLILADDLGYSDLGCYGGEIRTPHLDRLAKNGLRMTQMYNAARCCSTRASLLTGLYPHKAGVGAMSADIGKPGYRGFLTERCVTVATLLKQVGYRTYMSGKWHLRGAGNPNCIPTNRGFDEFYGHFKAYASYYRPELFVRLPSDRRARSYEATDFYATDAITDHAVDFIRHSCEKQDEQPFFLYVAYNAPHFPLQAPKETIETYIQSCSRGWDKIRAARFQRIRQLGLLPQQTKLSVRGNVTKVPDRNLDSPFYGQQIPAWETLGEARKLDLARRMAIYCAMVEIMDRNIGRVVQELTNQDKLENTLVVFLSDNGACAEWDPFGFDNNPYPKNLRYEGTNIERMGGRNTFHSYGTGWANACNTPFRLYKHYNHEGGISTPFIAHWPDGIQRKGQIERRPAHVIDLAATLLDLGKAIYPREHQGNEILPLAGRSLLPVFQNRPIDNHPIFFEHEGNRAVREGKWKVVWTNYTQRWELYDIDADRSETNDLASEFPHRVQQMDRLWHQWARRNFVEPTKVSPPAKGMPKVYYLR